MNKRIENKKINKQQIKYILTNLSAFLLIFVLLGALATLLINLFFFKDVNKEMKSYQEIIQTNIEEKQNPLGDTLISIGTQNSARISLVFYDKNENIIAYDSDLLSYLIEDYEEFAHMIYQDGFRLTPQYAEYIEKINDALQNDIFTVNERLFNQLKTETVEGVNQYYFQSLTFPIDNQKAPDVGYCKLLVNINGEISSRDAILRIYIFCAGLMFIFAVAASILLGSWSVKPIQASLEKQLTFVSDASHELRTPLAIVQSKLENILTKSNKTVYDVSSDIAISLKEISRLSKLTNDLLILAQSDNDSFEIASEEFNLKELLNDVASPFMEIAEIQNKKFSINGSDFNIIADKSKISQMLIIILDNALKYTTKDDEIKINIANNNNEYIISISDTGIGITDENKKHIFERFYRADKARSRETGGNGLGLSIAKTIVEAHKGQITVVDNNPKGTKFIIIIPKKS